MLLFVCSFAYATNPPTKAKSLNLVGQFIGAKDVKVEVFSYTADHTLEKISEINSSYHFDISVKTGQEYLVRFIHGDVVKYLYISKAPIQYEFEFDVDFSCKDCAVLRYNSRSSEYRLSVIDKTKIPLLPDDGEDPHNH